MSRVPKFMKYLDKKYSSPQNSRSKRFFGNEEEIVDEEGSLSEMSLSYEVHTVSLNNNSRSRSGLISRSVFAHSRNNSNGTFRTLGLGEDSTINDNQL